MLLLKRQMRTYVYKSCWKHVFKLFTVQQEDVQDGCTKKTHFLKYAYTVEWVD